MKTHSLRYKLYLYILPMVATACVLLASIFYFQLKQGLVDGLEREAFNIASQVSERAKEEQLHSLNDVIKFSETKEISALLSGSQNGSTEDVVSRLFFQLVSVKPRYIGLAILNKDNELVYSDSTHNQDIAEWSSETIKNTSTKNRPADIHLFHRNKKGIVSSIAEISDSGVHKGTLILFRKTPDYLLRRNDKDTNHHLFFQSFSRTFSQPLTKQDREIIQAYEEESEDNLVTINDTTWYGYTLDNNFGRVFVFLAAKNYMQQMKELTQNSVLLTIAIIIVCTIIIALFVSRIIVMPLKKLGDASTFISQGNTNNHTFPVERHDEIGDLGRLLLTVAQKIENNRKREYQLAYFDELTGLKNKQALISYIRNFDNPLITSSLGVWVIDIARFKQINDIHGYTVGNKLLKEIGVRLERFFDNYALNGQSLNQPVVGKCSGDEFVIAATMPDDCDENYAEILTKCLAKCLSKKILVESRFYELELFVGWEQGGNSGFEIYEKADMAMHEAKKERLNYYRFNGAILEKARYNQSLLDDIKKALDRQGFHLNYQPKCRALYPHQFREYEALIRWERDGFMVSPGEFIPFAEEANIIGGIDTWVSEQVVLDVRLMEQKGWSDFVVSFNVSGPRLADAVFIDNFKRTIIENNVNPKHLQIELTENSLVENVEASAAAIKDLHAMGVGVALDDFGTGHSSLSYIRDLPLASLKIDRSFVRNVEFNNKKTKLLKHIIEIGHSLGLTVVVEGVESESELAVIQSMNCDLVQGFLLHRPMPLEKLFSLYEERKELGIQ